MPVIAHIGNIPVEEWLPFVVPVVALYLYGRHKDRHRREAVQRLPDPRDLLDPPTVERVLARWAESRHKDASARHLPVLYPPGPDGLTPVEIAHRAHCEPATAEHWLEELEDLGYVDLEGDSPDQIVSLTIEGYDLVHVTEEALLAAAEDHRHESTATLDQSPQRGAG